MSTAGIEIRTAGAEQTRQLGKEIGSLLQPGDCLSLIGDLGAGKTVLTQGLAQGLGCPDPVVSPTFLFLQEYPGRLPLRHLDAYFAAKETQFLEEASQDVFDGEGVVVVEWGDQVTTLLPTDRLEVRISLLGPEERSIMLLGTGPRGLALAKEIAKSRGTQNSP